MLVFFLIIFICLFFYFLNVLMLNIFFGVDDMFFIVKVLSFMVVYNIVWFNFFFLDFINFGMFL